MFARPKRNKQVIVDRQILYLHEVMVAKCLAQPTLFTKVLDNLETRHTQGIIRYGSYLLWHSILETRDQPELFTSLVLATDSRTQALRRKTIFAGVLTEAEREAALTTYIASELN